MAEPATFPEEHVSNPLVYRRISGYAIAGLIAGCFYALIVLVWCAAGVRAGTPVLLSPWVQAIALLGAGLSVVALVYIRYSEDTVAGTKLAIWSLLLNIFFGLGYGAYYVATYFAIRQQANTFALRWFDLLKKDKVNQAFLETHEPAVRQRINPEDEDAINARFVAGAPHAVAMKTPLEGFRDKDFVRMLTQGGPAAQIARMGVKDWGYERGGYIVQRTYEIGTEEGLFEVLLTVQGTVSKTREFEGREWQVLMGASRLQNAQLSERAKEVSALREQSNHFVDDWCNKLAAGRLEEAYLDTRDPAERASLASAFNRKQVQLSASAVGLMAAEPLVGLEFLAWATDPNTGELWRQWFLPDYAALFHGHGLLQADQFRATDLEMKERLLNAVKAVFAPAQPDGPHLLGMSASRASSYRMWKVDQGRIQLPHDCKLSFKIGDNPRYLARGTILVESDPGEVKASRKPTWRIIRLELKNGEDRTRTTPALRKLLLRPAHEGFAVLLWAALLTAGTGILTAARVA